MILCKIGCGSLMALWKGREERRLALTFVFQPSVKIKFTVRWYLRFNTELDVSVFNHDYGLK